MNQLYRVTVNSEGITDETTQCTISKQMQRFYNTATFYTSLVLIPESVIKIEYGSQVFDGFIYSAAKTNKGMYRIECRTKGGYLTEPFVSSKTDIVIPVKTSHELCAYYSTIYNIPIIITAIDLDFGGEFEQKGTVINALSSVANATGADFYFDGQNIIIEPAKWIENDGDIISPENIVDFEPFSKTIEQKGVRYITVGNSQVSENTSINISCNAEVDGCTGQTILRVVPHDAFEYSEGLNSLAQVQTPLLYKGTIAMKSYIELDADIVSISSVKVNNAVVTDYSFVNNMVMFSSPKRGYVMIDYVGHGYSGYANNKMIGYEKMYSFTVFYGGCNVFYGDGVLNCPGSSGHTGSSDGEDRNSYSECGDVIVMMPDNTNYAKGFSFNTFGGVPNIYFYNGSTKVNIGISHTSGTISKLEPVVLSEYGSNPSLRYKFRYEVNSVNGVQSMGVDIPYTSNSEYLYLSKFYPSVTVSYQSQGNTYTVQGGDLLNDEVIMVIDNNVGEPPCEYQLYGTDYTDPNTLECAIGTDVPVDIVGIHGITVDSVVSKSIIVTNPDTSTTSYTADSFGRITILNVQNGTYFIDTSTCYPGSYILFNSKAV